MVTVIVLVYKNLEKLNSTIRSIFQQDYRSIELIVSDDSSPEFVVTDVEKWIRGFSEYSEDISLLVRKNPKNLGIVKHYNQVIKMSIGEIIIPLSCGDVFYRSSTITEITDFFSKNDCLLATAKRKCGNMILPTSQQLKIIEKGGRKLIDSLCRGNFISGSCIYYTRIFFENYGFFDERMLLVDDYPMLLRVLFSGQSIPVLDEITIIYEMNGVSNQKVPNLLFDKDMENIFSLVIEPNKNKIGIETYRHLKCRNYIKTHTGGFRWLYCLLYMDVLLLKGCYFIKKKFTKISGEVE